MKRYVVGRDRSQSTLFPEVLDDYIAEDNPVRVVDVFVDELDPKDLGFEGAEPEVTGRKETDDADIHQCPGDAVRCKTVRSGARLIWHKNRHQPTRGEHDSRALVYRRQSALPSQSWRFSGSPATSPAKRRYAIAPTLQATPSPLASIDSQIVRRQWVSPATVAWNFLAPGFATIDIGEVNDRRTISTDQAPATN